MNEFITTEENLSCDHCEDSPNWSRRLFPFQIGFESLDRAQTKSLELKVRYGCNFFPGQFDGDEAWSIAANGKCFDAVSRIEAPFVVFETISPSNHPYHFIGSPYNILATGLPFDEAASFASDVFLQPGQKILLYFRSGWCVIASLSEEQSEVVERLRSQMRETLTYRQQYDLDEIESFKEFVFKVTDELAER